jgi:hypothetical protein
MRYVTSAGEEGVGQRRKFLLWVPLFCILCKERCDNFVCDWIESDKGWKHEVKYFRHCYPSRNGFVFKK